MSEAGDPAATRSAGEVARRLARLFAACGLPDHAAGQLAGAMIEADLQGVSSHGVQLAELYLDRLRAGSISVAVAAEIVSDRGAAVVLDAGDMFGHLAADQAMAIAIARARVHGAGVVAVRRGFHFGMAGRYVCQAAEAGCVGIAMANVRPLMAAPGGAERMVGNNPLAIGLPAADRPIILDMATSEAAFAKLRQAAASNAPIPGNWAVTRAGEPTTDAAEAIAGMLLPFGGAKGFALAFMIDLLCGLLSGGGHGEQVRGMMQTEQPMNCSFLFIAVEISRFRPLDDFKRDAAAAAARLRNSARAPGVSAIRVPGEQRARRLAADPQHLTIGPASAAALARIEQEIGLPPWDEAKGYASC